MKKINLLFISLLVCTVGAIAQTYLYNTTKEINMGDYIYKCETSESDNVLLYNKANTLTHATQTYKDGRKLGWDHSNKGDVESDNNTAQRKLAESIVKNAFTSAEKRRINGEKLMVRMVISPKTGKVLEVRFDFWRNNALATISVSTYRNIEVALKNQLQFQVTEKGRKLNFLVRGLYMPIK